MDSMSSIKSVITALCGRQFSWLYLSSEPDR